MTWLTVGLPTMPFSQTSQLTAGQQNLLQREINTQFINHKQFKSLYSHRHTWLKFIQFLWQEAQGTKCMYITILLSLLQVKIIALVYPLSDLSVHYS